VVSWVALNFSVPLKFCLSVSLMPLCLRGHLFTSMLLIQLMEQPAYASLILRLKGIIVVVVVCVVLFCINQIKF
jgi:hypothetical protein